MEILYTCPGRSYPGAVITNEPDWRSVAAYYLTLPGYRLVRVTAEICCVACKGQGCRFVRPRGKRKAPAWACKRIECPACAGLGYLGVVVIPTDSIDASEYRDPTVTSSGVHVTPKSVMTEPSSPRVPA